MDGAGIDRIARGIGAGPAEGSKLCGLDRSHQLGLRRRQRRCSSSTSINKRPAASAPDSCRPTTCPERVGNECANLSKLLAEAENRARRCGLGARVSRLPASSRPSCCPPAPDGRFLDRGRMVELSWNRVKDSLSGWQAGVAGGWRPASIFNATIAETGEPLLFSTTNLYPDCNPEGEESDGIGAHFTPPWRGPRLMTFACLYSGFDIDLVTATRLASGFPYVLPVPRAWPDPGLGDGHDEDFKFRYHLIDGGYYDNYGVNTAVQWLDSKGSNRRWAPEPKARLPRKVLVVQIRSFPDLAGRAAKPPAAAGPVYRAGIIGPKIEAGCSAVCARIRLLNVRTRTEPP